ncbi:hypothetical protein ACGFK1_04885 [Mycobacterium sp. NPDC048908]|uniref:DUF7159 family protein n=1 Tax=Mycobacterium sp. NPDC048908 TaxID=3364292 RepID=UPI0037142AB2
MTPTKVSIALVEGGKAEGRIIEQDVFDIAAADGSASPSAAEHVVAAILGTQEGAFAAGHHLVSIGLTCTDQAEAAELRQALIAHDVDDVLLVSELQAAAAVAQRIGRAVGYDKTALMFVERDKATLAIVDTVDSSVVTVLSRSAHDGDRIVAVAELITGLQAHDSVVEGMVVVSAVDVGAIKAHLQNLVSVPVIAAEEPQLALARGAALASASAPRYDTSTIGLAYSNDPDETWVHSTSLVDVPTTFLGHADVITDAARVASDADVPERRKPFLLVGASLAAIFIAGMMALTIAIVVSVQPTAEQDSENAALHPGAAAPQLRPAPPTPSRPAPAPVPPAAAESPARTTVAHLMEVPAPPPEVVVHSAAPAPAAPGPAAPAPAAPPPAPAPPPLVVLPPLISQWLPSIIQPQWQPPPPFINPGPKGPRRGHGGGHGHGGD